MARTGSRSSRPFGESLRRQRLSDDLVEVAHLDLLKSAPAVMSGSGSTAAARLGALPPPDFSKMLPHDRHGSLKLREGSQPRGV
jgi:hypothetical protein